MRPVHEGPTLVQVLARRVRDLEGAVWALRQVADPADVPPAYIDFEQQCRSLHVEWRTLVDQVTAALAIHHPCHSVHPWKTVEDACERSHYEPAETPECVGCGYDSYEIPWPWPCATARALGATR